MQDSYLLSMYMRHEMAMATCRQRYILFIRIYYIEACTSNISNLHSYGWHCKVLRIFMHLLNLMYTIYRTTGVAYTFLWQSMVNFS